MRTYCRWQKRLCAVYTFTQTFFVCAVRLCLSATSRCYKNGLSLFVKLYFWNVVICVRYCFQVLQDLSSYESRAQSSYYNPPIFEPLPQPRPPPGPDGPVGAPAGPAAPRSRRKRSLCYRCWWPYYSGGTNSDEVFTVNIISSFIFTFLFVQFCCSFSCSPLWLQ